VVRHRRAAKLFLLSVGVFFPVYLNTFHGIRSVDAGLVEMARSYGLSGWALYRDVILPGALPSILVGVRFSLGLVWVLLIVAETISAQAGIGYMTMNAREFLQTDVVLVGVLLYALLGKAADLSRAAWNAVSCAGIQPTDKGEPVMQVNHIEEGRVSETHARARHGVRVALRGLSKRYAGARSWTAST
jgi:ABC-type nitrate/sulfonate/bicarbonate transport system permease component